MAYYIKLNDSITVNEEELFGFLDRTHIERLVLSFANSHYLAADVYYKNRVFSIEDPK